MKAGKVTAVLTSGGAIYGIWMGTKGAKGFWQTAGMALLFSFAGAAIGTVYETVTAKEEEPAKDQTKVGFSSTTQKRAYATGMKNLSSERGMSFKANGGTIPCYKGSNIALRNSNPC